jgi:hypothetical protein
VKIPDVGHVARSRKPVAFNLALREFAESVGRRESREHEAVA